jgi:uncharacterized surface protein with fasciclin (FAS1) repeats
MRRLTSRYRLAQSTALAAAIALAFALAFAPAGALAQADTSTASPATAAASPNLMAAGDIVATLKGNPNFTILVKAVDAAQLGATLSSVPGLTLFAPTDAAFNALPPSELAALMKSDNAGVLQKIVIYHLVHLTLDSAKLKGAKGPVPSVEGSQLQLDGSGAVVKVNDASVIQADVKATNGVIHVIDKVLIPADVTVPSS